MHCSSCTWTKEDDGGFTLIELLVVMIIIGVLAAIAIPTFLNQRENSWRAAMKSDLRNSATAAQAWAADAGRSTYGALTTSAITTTLGNTLTAGVTVQVAQTGVTGFCLRADYVSLPGQPMWFDSLAGAASTVDCSSATY